MSGVVEHATRLGPHLARVVAVEPLGGLALVRIEALAG